MQFICFPLSLLVRVLYVHLLCIVSIYVYEGVYNIQCCVLNDAGGPVGTQLGHLNMEFKHLTAESKQKKSIYKVTVCAAETSLILFECCIKR